MHTLICTYTFNKTYISIKFHDKGRKLNTYRRQREKETQGKHNKLVTVVKSKKFNMIDKTCFHVSNNTFV